MALILIVDGKVVREWDDFDATVGSVADGEFIDAQESGAEWVGMMWVKDSPARKARSG
jgi:hypothetical protein